ncbi:histidine--tRNA ligase [bacterium]|nr:histidine--tRNA ligase [candidate division CSSED10-310 bacterium]
MNKAEKLSVVSYRGTRDFYPEDMRIRSWIFDRMKETAMSFGYEEYDGPMLESFELYAAKSGEELVNEQLYHFFDRADRHVAIRPEMTPTVARMVAARINDLSRPIRWFSFPNLWRYEKPQRGRLREHWQFNVDILGSDSIGADQEIIEIAIQVMIRLGAGKNDFRIHISNRRMLTYFLHQILDLPEGIWGGVCRAIDKRSKIPHETFEEMLRELELTSHQISELGRYLSLSHQNIDQHPVSESDGYGELRQIWNGLSESGLDTFCTLDLSIVRGLDYYTGTVFEMYDLAPENRRALFGGGRYDNLVGLFSKDRLSGVGFGMGDVTVRDFLEIHGLIPNPEPPIQVHVALFNEELRRSSGAIASLLRSAGYRTTLQLDPVKLAKQFKWADSKSIPIVILQGPDEKKQNLVQVKNMLTHSQQVVSERDLVETVRQSLAGD